MKILSRFYQNQTVFKILTQKHEIITRISKSHNTQQFDPDCVTIVFEYYGAISNGIQNFNSDFIKISLRIY